MFACPTTKSWTTREGLGGDRNAMSLDITFTGLHRSQGIPPLALIFSSGRLACRLSSPGHSSKSGWHTGQSCRFSCNALHRIPQGRICGQRS